MRVGGSRSPKRFGARQSGALLFNGTHIRIVDADQLHSDAFWSSTSTSRWTTRKSSPSFWGVVHASTFSPGANGETRLQAIVHASQRHSASVSQSLREGVIEASGDVVAALLGSLGRRTAACSVNDAFEQALTIVYRVLFSCCSLRHAVSCPSGIRSIETATASSRSDGR